MDLDSLINDKMDSDAEFQESLADLSDEDREATIRDKREELIKSEFSDLHGKSVKSEELAGNYKTRAEKAEEALKKAQEGGGGGDSSSGGGDDKPKGLSTKDLLALSKADIHDDDVDWIVEQAERSEKSVAEILKNDETQAVLNHRAEKRKSADASNTSKSRRRKKAPDGRILADELSSEGKVPEPGSPEAEELFFARRGGKRRD